VSLQLGPILLDFSEILPKRLHTRVPMYGHLIETDATMATDWPLSEIELLC